MASHSLAGLADPRSRLTTDAGSRGVVGGADNRRGPGTGRGGDPAAISAGVTRDQWQRFLDFYRPIEDQVLQQAQQTDFTAEGDTAGRTAAAGVQASRGTLARNLRRAGTSLTAGERTAVARRQDLSLAKSVGRAENTTRRGLRDSRVNLLRGIVNIGTGVANTAQAGLQGVADLAAQREVNFQQQRTAARSANISAGAAAAALIIAAI